MSSEGRASAARPCEGVERARQWAVPGEGGSGSCISHKSIKIKGGNFLTPCEPDVFTLSKKLLTPFDH